MNRTADSGGSRSAQRAVGVVIAVALVFAVLYLARPATVWELLATSDPVLLALAAASAGAALVIRGARLVALLPPGDLRLNEGALVAAAAQAAALFAPARVGEFALPWLLRRVTGRDLAAGVGTLLAARALDLAGLGLWAGWAVLAIWGWTEPVALLAAAALVAPPLMLPMTLRLVHRLAVRCLAPAAAAAGGGPATAADSRTVWRNSGGDRPGWRRRSPRRSSCGRFCGCSPGFFSPPWGFTGPPPRWWRVRLPPR